MSRYDILCGRPSPVRVDYTGWTCPACRKWHPYWENEPEAYSVLLCWCGTVVCCQLSRLQSGQSAVACVLPATDATRDMAAQSSLHGPDEPEMNGRKELCLILTYRTIDYVSICHPEWQQTIDDIVQRVKAAVQLREGSRPPHAVNGQCEEGYECPYCQQWYYYGCYDIAHAGSLLSQACQCGAVSYYQLSRWYRTPPRPAMYRTQPPPGRAPRRKCSKAPTN
jgi:hypothetical protein